MFSTLFLILFISSKVIFAKSVENKLFKYVEKDLMTNEMYLVLILLI